MRRDALMRPVSNSARRGVSQMFFLQNAYFFSWPMKKKIGIRLLSGRPKRNAKLDREKHRKSAKNKQAARAMPLWLQVLSRVD
jgi:hypothetical protein